jgi:hypothetical protein
MIFSRITFSRMTFSRIRFSIMSFSRKTFSKIALNNIRTVRGKKQKPIQLSVVMLNVVAPHGIL